MKNMSQTNKNITIKDMKRAQLSFSFQPGEGSSGKLLLFLIIKLGQFIIKVITYPFNKSEKEDDEKSEKIDDAGDKKK